MPDRWWWVKVGAACAMLVVPMGIVAVVLGIGGFSQTFGGITNLFSAGTIAGSLALYAVVAVMYIWLAIALARDGLRGRRRLQVRQRAMQGAQQGAQDALPRAQVPSRADALPDLSAKPLELLWEAKRGTRAVTGPLSILLMVMQVAMVVLVALGCFVPLFFDLRQGNQPSFGEVALALFGVLILVAVGVLVVLFRRYARVMFGRRFGVIANEDGLTELRQDGRQVTIPWGEMRLFEIDRKRLPIMRSTVTRTYRVYSAHGMVTWGGIQRGGTDFRPAGMSLGEMALQLDALAALITARTALQPRTFTPGIETTAETTPDASAQAGARPAETGRVAPDPSSLGQRVRAALSLFAVVIVNLGCTVAAVVFAPLANSLLDDVAAVAPTICGVLCFALAVIALRGPRPQEAAIPLEVLTSSLPGGDGVPARGEASWPGEAAYALTIGMGPLMRVPFLLFGLALMSAWVPLVAYCIQRVPHWATILHLPVAAPSSPNISLLADPFRLMLVWLYLFLLMMYGIGGLAFATVAFVFKGRVWRADRLGLSTDVGSLPTSLPWSAVAGIAARQRQGQVVSYLVRDAEGAIKFGWPAASGRVGRVLISKAGAESDPSAPAPRPVTPDQLAALVAQRAGLTITPERDPRER